MTFFTIVLTFNFKERIGCDFHTLEDLLLHILIVFLVEMCEFPM